MLARIVLTVFQINLKTGSHCESCVNTVLLSIHYSHFIVKALLKTNQISDFSTPCPRRRPGRASLRSITSPHRYTYCVGMPHVRHIIVALHHRSATLMGSACLICAPHHRSATLMTSTSSTILNTYELPYDVNIRHYFEY